MYSGVLPALHLPNGDLLPSQSIEKWINEQQEHTGSKGKEREEAEGLTEKEESIAFQKKTYTALVEQKLQSALVSCGLFDLPAVG